MYGSVGALDAGWAMLRRELNIDPPAPITHLGRARMDIRFPPAALRDNGKPRQERPGHRQRCFETSNSNA